MISNHSFKKIHPFSSAYQIKKYGGAGAYPCCHGARGGVHHGHVASLTQS